MDHTSTIARPVIDEAPEEEEPLDDNASTFTLLRALHRRSVALAAQHSLPQYPFRPKSLDSNTERHPIASTTATAATATIAVTPTRVSWPAADIPVEIFELIASYLTRSEVKTLRLVCKEFENKVSARYFKNVVVPFRSELYGDLVRNETGPRQHPSSALFSNGTRIFQSFGPHILRFALSLELDENALAYPPIKPAQVAVPTFWGVYRWPHQDYARYSDLQGIEQTADETQSMKEALKCLTKVINMGLCCDAGLGFLTGPDTVARNAAPQHPVFSTQNWRVDQRTVRRPDENDSIVTIADFNGMGTRRRKTSHSDPRSLQNTVLEKMAFDAGFRGDQIEEAIQLLLTTENAHPGTIDFDERPVVRTPNLTLRRHVIERPPPPAHLPGITPETDGAESAESQANRRYALSPASLTRAQKELLLELEWAHRAMIQSYVIAMVDNASIGCYENLTTLTIAKIPSCHVHILYRRDYWSCFPNLTNVSVGIIPDWRKITKPAPGCIEDESVSPIKAVAKAYKLLKSFIGKQRRIESLHFEWICGGEFAPSSFQRNQHVLPAPFLSDPTAMSAFGTAAYEGRCKFLKMPHIKHLSLKNCWAAPHVFLQTIRQMALASLEKLDLESVSISGQPVSIPQFLPVIQNLPMIAGFNAANLNHLVTQNGFVAPANQAHLLPGPPPPPPQLAPPPNVQDGIDDDAHHFVNLGGLLNHPAIPGPPQPPAVPESPPETLVFPELLTWPGILEHFSPSLNIRNHLVDENDPEATQVQWQQKLHAAKSYLPKANRLLDDESRYNLRSISFKSCGYICLEATWVNSRALLPPGAHGVVPPSNNQTVPSRIMQRSWDKDLGQILPYIRPQEAFNLTHAFRMELGWESVYPDKLVEDAIADGVDFPGMGRFSGTLDIGRNGLSSATTSSDTNMDSGESSGSE